MTLANISDIIDGFGVEYVPSKLDTYSRAVGLEYVNMGDTYRPTIIYDRMTKRFTCESWGGIVETQPRSFSHGNDCVYGLAERHPWKLSLLWFR